MKQIALSALHHNRKQEKEEYRDQNPKEQKRKQGKGWAM